MCASEALVPAEGLPCTAPLPTVSTASSPAKPRPPPNTNHVDIFDDTPEAPRQLTFTTPVCLMLGFVGTLFQQAFLHLYRVDVTCAA